MPVQSRWVQIAAAVVLAAGAAAGGWAIGRSGHGRIGTLETRVSRVEREASALTAERDRIKAERDRLEEQLAAGNASPHACPNATLSTAQAQLVARFSVEYPCGWNVLEDPLQTPAADSPRKGLTLDGLFFSALPISRAPRDAPIAEITVDTWYDDANVSGDALPSFANWLSEAKGRFTSVTQTTVRTAAGMTVTKLSGSMTLFDQPRPALLYVWTWNDPDGVRKISEAFALDPGPAVTKTIGALVRSFRLLGA